MRQMGCLQTTKNYFILGKKVQKFHLIHTKELAQDAKKMLTWECSFAMSQKWDQ